VLAATPGIAWADGTFAVMSYNVKGLPEIPFVIEDRTDQMHDIAEKLEDFHTADGPYFGMASVVGLQEVFAHDYYEILTAPETVSYDFITDKDQRGEFNTGDGLTLLSDFQGENFERTQWEMCNGTLTEDGSDCDTPKGFSFAEVTLEPGAKFHLYTLHADAGQGLQDQAARRSNINQLIEAMNESSPAGTPVVVLGDTNSRYTRVGTDNIQDLLTMTGVHDVWVDLRRGGIVPAAGVPITDDCETTPSTGNCEEVDKIFYRNGDHLVFSPDTYQVLRQMFMGTMKPLSDHDPVAVEFEYSIVNPTTTTSTTTTTLGDRPCGDPIEESSGLTSAAAGSTVVAGDALFVLKSAVGGITCPLCTCDVNDTATITATDALIVLKVAVGQNATLDCPPCDGQTTTTTTTTTITTTTTLL
jgi:endonuclease/exonuclease/phosphatase family metal-dependent hydrolase